LHIIGRNDEIEPLQPFSDTCYGTNILHCWESCRIVHVCRWQTHHL